MTDFKRPMQIRWSDLDPNFHLRHSVYYDLGATLRTIVLTEYGITPAAMHQHQVGPVLFREEAFFKREIHFGDPVEMSFALLKCRKDMSRWSIQHQLYKNPETLSAIITVEGAWIDTALRKLTAPPEQFIAAFAAFPRAEAFEWL